MPLNLLILRTVVPWRACTTTSGVSPSHHGYPSNKADFVSLGLGNILAGWTTYGTNLHMADSSWSWRLPTLVQCIIPGIIMSIIMFFPETPRWLLAKDRREEAIAIMAKYHGDGDENSPLVQLQLQQITEDFAQTHNDNPWWDFRELANTRAARYRLAMVIAMAFFGQWSGNNGKSLVCESFI
jgi:MFS family permease